MVKIALSEPVLCEILTECPAQTGFTTGKYQCPHGINTKHRAADIEVLVCQLGLEAHVHSCQPCVTVQQGTGVVESMRVCQYHVAINHACRTLFLEASSDLQEGVAAYSLTYPTPDPARSRNGSQIDVLHLRQQTGQSLARDLQTISEWHVHW